MRRSLEVSLPLLVFPPSTTYLTFSQSLCLVSVMNFSQRNSVFYNTKCLNKWECCNSISALIAYFVYIYVSLALHCLFTYLDAQFLISLLFSETHDSYIPLSYDYSFVTHSLLICSVIPHLLTHVQLICSHDPPALPISSTISPLSSAVLLNSELVCSLFSFTT